MATAKQKEDPIYISPMVVGPTIKELEDISAELNLGLEGSTVLEEYQSVINDSLELVNQLDDLVEPSLPVKYPRTSGYRPSRKENPHNAWYYKSTVKGAAIGILSGKRIAIKDSIAVAGIPMMMGCYALEGYVPDFDATVVTRVLDEGGVILGKATCEDLCYSANSHTSAKGPVSNPLNKQHCAGGSSSGCAVLVACDEVDMAIGGDQGGSIRVPASWCGVVGLKPTFGLVPYTGAACNEYTVIAGYDDGRDARQLCNVEVPSYFKNLKNAPPKPLRIAVLTEGFGHEVSDPEVDKLILHAINRFAARSGATVEDVSIPLHKMAVALCVSIMAVEGVDCLFTSGCAGLNHTGYYPTSMMSGVGARLKANMTKLAPCHKARLLLGNYLKKKYCAVYGKAQNLRRLLTKGYDDVLEKFDLVAMPTTPFTAPKLPTQAGWMKEILGHDNDMTWNLKAGNLTGHPSISINAGFVESLPVGLLLTGVTGESVRVAICVRRHRSPKIGWRDASYLGDMCLRSDACRRVSHGEMCPLAKCVLNPKT